MLDAINDLTTLRSMVDAARVYALACHDQHRGSDADAFIDVARGLADTLSDIDHTLDRDGDASASFPPWTASIAAE